MLRAPRPEMIDESKAGAGVFPVAATSAAGARASESREVRRMFMVGLPYFFAATGNEK
jgi:hypothetical protein